MKPDIVQADNTWVHLRRRGLDVACRDCGLVHRYTTKIVEGRVYIAAERLSGATRSRRREGYAMGRATWPAGGLKQQNQ